MTAPHPADDRLPGAFRELAATAAARCSDEDLERAWKAVACELPAEERRQLVERVAVDPAFAEAWRIAHALQREHGGVAAPLPRARSWSATWIGLAAALVIGIGAALYQIQREPAADVYRAQAQYTIAALVASDSTLARDAFRLRWTPGPDGTRYDVQVTTEDLRVLATARDLTTAELLVPRASLEAVPPQARVLWQVTATLPGGQRVTSETFVVRTD